MKKLLSLLVIGGTLFLAGCCCDNMCESKKAVKEAPAKQEPKAEKPEKKMVKKAKKVEKKQKQEMTKKSKKSEKENKKTESSYSKKQAYDSERFRNAPDAQKYLG